MWAAAKHDVSAFLPEQERNKRSHEQGSAANKRIGRTGLQVKTYPGNPAHCSSGNAASALWKGRERWKNVLGERKKNAQRLFLFDFHYHHWPLRVAYSHRERPGPRGRLRRALSRDSACFSFLWFCDGVCKGMLTLNLYVLLPFPVKWHFFSST